MIVPSVPLEFVLSARTQRFLKTKPVRDLGIAPPLHFLTQWRVDLADDADGGRWFMVTNIATLYTFLLPRPPRCSFAEFQESFRLRLSFALLAASPPLEWNPSEVIVVRGNPRAIVGSMNNMAQLLAWPRPPGGFEPYKDNEERLQHTPFSAVGKKGRYGFPDRTWLEHLNELARRSNTGSRVRYEQS